MESLRGRAAAAAPAVRHQGGAASEGVGWCMKLFLLWPAWGTSPPLLWLLTPDTGTSASCRACEAHGRIRALQMQRA